MIGSNNVISTKRLQTAANKETYSGSSNLSGIDCYIERAKPEIALTYEDIPGYKIYSMFIEGNVDIIISDQVTDSQGNVYIVKDVAEYDNNTDTCDMTEVTMYKKYDVN